MEVPVALGSDGVRQGTLHLVMRLVLSIAVSLQSPLLDGISDGIRAHFRLLRHAEQAFAAKLNSIARYVERMLSTSQGGYKG
jgi:hypothetical protein